jgi:hypothetical protein
MTIKELKEFISDLPDDMIIVRPGTDHEYQLSFIEEGTALVAHNNPDYIYEDYGDQCKDNKKDKRINVLIVT